jgi:hypothetical protein
MLRPIWTVIIRRTPLSSHSSRDAYSRDAYMRTTSGHHSTHHHGGSTHLTTLTKLRKTADSESILELAGAAASPIDGSIHSGVESATAYDAPQGVSTVITGQGSPRRLSTAAQLDARAIVVQNEMSVKYSRPR